MLWNLRLISLIALCNANTETELRGETCQSSNYTNGAEVFSSERAMNGDKDTCSHTEIEINSWWRIDLLGVYRIGYISIFNKQPGYTDITGAQIYIGNSRENNGTTNRLCQNLTTFITGQQNEFSFEKDVSGRYITVFFPENKPLVLCEVKIYGTRKESPFELIRENKTWVDALDYCRDQDMNMASIVDGETQTWAELNAINSSTPFVWLGLRYTCTLEFWFWVEDLPLKFSRWSPNGKIDECNRSGAMEKQGDHLWFSKSADNEFNFICTKLEKSMCFLGDKGH